ncbi:LuxR C-terminal-related transcriptional regulator [Streptacidiphilus carbonis]|uniref:LuxR C-terminal-related transcriptional regulator n=1 Tax=Streptacidiphilus carbonis TaxID=105422 RepID=UPI0005A8AC09|nr:LuxR C-terminal-related transcriptional regulator [Streptacidiphilus carbonis]
METGTSGVSEHAELLYAELVRNGVAGQEPAPSEALEELLELGLVSRHAEGGLVLNDPASVSLQLSLRLSSEVSTLLQEAAAVQQRLADISDEFHEAQRDSAGPVTYLHGLEVINDAIGNAVGKIEFEMLCAQPHGTRSQENLDLSYRRDKPALDRGVTIRTIYQTNQRQKPMMRDHVRRSTKAGELVRTVPWPFTRAIIIDRKVAFMPNTGLSDVFQDTGIRRDPYRSALCVNDPLLVAHFVEHFEFSWALGQQWDGAVTGEHAAPPLDQWERLILEYLDQDLSLEAIAARLSISERTLGKRLTALRAKMEVNSLYGLGRKWQGLKKQPFPAPVPESSELRGSVHE